jgi:hypothetical protein
LRKGINNILENLCEEKFEFVLCGAVINDFGASQL